MADGEDSIVDDATQEDEPQSTIPSFPSSENETNSADSISNFLEPQDRNEVPLASGKNVCQTNEMRGLNKKKRSSDARLDLSSILTSSSVRSSMTEMEPVGSDVAPVNNSDRKSPSRDDDGLDHPKPFEGGEGVPLYSCSPHDLKSCQSAQAHSAESEQEAKENVSNMNESLLVEDDIPTSIICLSKEGCGANSTTRTQAMPSSGVEPCVGAPLHIRSLCQDHSTNTRFVADSKTLENTTSPSNRGRNNSLILTTIKLASAPKMNNTAKEANLISNSPNRPPISPQRSSSLSVDPLRRQLDFLGQRWAHQSSSFRSAATTALRTAPRASSGGLPSKDKRLSFMKAVAANLQTSQRSMLAQSRISLNPQTDKSVPHPTSNDDPGRLLDESSLKTRDFTSSSSESNKPFAPHNLGAVALPRFALGAHKPKPTSADALTDTGSSSASSDKLPTVIEIKLQLLPKRRSSQPFSASYNKPKPGRRLSDTRYKSSGNDETKKSNVFERLYKNAKRPDPPKQHPSSCLREESKQSLGRQRIAQLSMAATKTLRSFASPARSLGESTVSTLSWTDSVFEELYWNNSKGKRTRSTSTKATSLSIGGSSICSTGSYYGTLLSTTKEEAGRRLKLERRLDYSAYRGANSSRQRKLERQSIDSKQCLKSGGDAVEKKLSVFERLHMDSVKRHELYATRKIKRMEKSSKSPTKPKPPRKTRASVVKAS